MSKFDQAVDELKKTIDKTLPKEIPLERELLLIEKIKGELEIKKLQLEIARLKEMQRRRWPQ